MGDSLQPVGLKAGRCSLARGNVVLLFSYFFHLTFRLEHSSLKVIYKLSQEQTEAKASTMAFLGTENILGLYFTATSAFPPLSPGRASKQGQRPQPAWPARGAGTYSQVLLQVVDSDRYILPAFLQFNVGKPGQSEIQS